MSLTDKNLVNERAHLSGTQRVYRVGRYGLSLVNSPMLHSYEFEWEAAVLDFGDSDSNEKFKLTYDTPLTDDVEVFMSDDEATSFIDKAFAWFDEQRQ